MKGKPFIKVVRHILHFVELKTGQTLKRNQLVKYLQPEKNRYTASIPCLFIV